MAQYYGSMQGGRGEATRTGTKSSGMEGHLRGWNTGARVIVGINDQNRDCVTVYRTQGSSGSSSMEIEVAHWVDGEETVTRASRVLMTIADEAEHALGTEAKIPEEVMRANLETILKLAREVLS